MDGDLRNIHARPCPGGDILYTAVCTDNDACPPWTSRVCLLIIYRNNERPVRRIFICTGRIARSGYFFTDRGGLSKRRAAAVIRFLYAIHDENGTGTWQ